MLNKIDTFNPENEINMKGEYEVFQSDTYKYIIID